MKKLIWIIASSLALSCSEDAIPDTGGTRLLSINGTVEYPDSRDTWQETYHYDPNGRLTLVENTRSLGRRYEIAYEGERILQYLTYQRDNNRLIFRDSVAYTADGLIDKIYSFSINAGPELPLDFVIAFDYDSLQRVVERKSYLWPSEQYFIREKYDWDDTHIVRKQDYYYEAGEEEFRYEYFYAYDDQHNYKIGIPYYLNNPINWGPHNVTVMDWRDYYGNLDLICRPCQYTYRYNRDGYPVEITTNYGRSEVATYE